MRWPNLGLSNPRRAAALAIVICALALTVAVPLRTYLSQRSEIVEQQQTRQSLRAQVDALAAQNQKLQDPEQIQAEARERLRYVMPGETPYLVQVPSDTAPPPRPGQPKTPAQNGKPWYDNLWNSVGR